MSFPTEPEELALHERVLKRDPVAPPEVFRVFMDPILRILTQEMGCLRGDAAYDSAIDVVLSYLSNPERFDPKRGRLSTYLTQAAKKRLVDRQRSTAARTRRDQEFASVFELQARSPKEAMEISMEARLALEMLERSKLSGEERMFLGLILQGERSTQRLGEVLGLQGLPEKDVRRKVKQNRDRLMKWLERLGKEAPHAES